MPQDLDKIPWHKGSHLWFKPMVEVFQMDEMCSDVDALNQKSGIQVKPTYYGCKPGKVLRLQILKDGETARKLASMYIQKMLETVK